MNTKRSVALALLGGFAYETKVFVGGQDGNAEIVDSPGGSAWLMTLAARAIGCRAALVATVGHDPLGDSLLSELGYIGGQFRGARTSKFDTLRFVSIVASGEPQTLYFSPPSPENLDMSQINWSGIDALLLGYCSPADLATVANLRSSPFLRVANASGAILGLPASEAVGILRSFDIALLNEAEISSLASVIGCKTEQVVEEVSDDGALLVIMRNRSGSVAFHHGKQIASAPAESVAVADATGAGDALTVGFVTGLLGGLSIDAALKVGSRLAGRMCTLQRKARVRPGAWLDALSRQGAVDKDDRGGDRSS